MKCGLHEAYSGGVARACAIERGLHQLPPDAEILRGGIDGNRAEAGDDGTLVEAIAADDAALVFGDDAVKIPVGKHHREHASGIIGRGKIAGESVGRIDCGKSGIADWAAGGSVLWEGWANR